MTPGDRLGPYEIVERIGAGGMGEVYRATDTRLHREVAIKISAERFSERFEREAQSIAALNHPNICTLFDVGPNYLVMELVEGPTLDDHLRQGALPLDEALRIARQIAEALDAAHEKGIVHRDLKPGNVKVKPDGTVKVLDFGLAKVMEPAGGSGVNSPTLTMGATQAGVILGTAGYMAPEQAKGQPVDKRADIWAFGVVLWEMLSGQRLFHGETVSDTLAAVLRADVDLKSLPARTPARTRLLLARCLERDPKRRLRDIGDARIELDKTDDAPAPAPARRQPWIPWTAAALLFAGVAAWGWLRRPSESPRPVTRWEVSLPGTPSALALSRDGTRLVYQAGDGVSQRLWLRMMDQLQSKPIPGTEGGFLPFFSPDGQWVAFFSNNQGVLKKIPITGGTAITLCEAGFFGGSWSDDGTIVFTGRNGLMRATRDGKCETLTTADQRQGVSHRWAQLLPGGQAALFTIGKEGAFDNATIAVLDLKSRQYHAVVNGGAAARYVPSGHLVYLRGSTVFAVPFDAQRLEVAGAAVPAVEGVYFNAAGGFADYAVSDTGELVYQAETRSVTNFSLVWVDRRGVEQPLPAPPHDYEAAKLAPDGARAAVSFPSNSGGANQIWIYEMARGTVTRLTSEGFNTDPLWTPDGRRVTFRSNNGGKSGIYWVLADGSAQPELLLAGPGVPDSFTPDGKTLVFTLNSGGKSHIWTVAASGGANVKPQLLFETAFSEAEARVSPDGRWVAYTSDEAGKAQVYLRRFPGPGGVTPISVDAGQSALWSRDGRELFYSDPGNAQEMVVDIQTASSLRIGRPQIVPGVRAFAGLSADLAPDGKRFLMIKIPAADAGAAKFRVVNNWFEELRRLAPVGPK